MLPIALGLTSGLLWGVGDFIGGHTSRRMAPVAVAFWSQLVGAVFLSAILVIARPEFVREGLFWGYAGGLCTGFGLLAFYRGLAAGAMSIVAPISAAGAIVPTVVAFARGEAPSGGELAGMALVMAGVVVLSLPSKETPHPSGRPMYVTLLAIGAALGFGFFYVFVDQAGDTGASPAWVIFAARFGALTAVVGHAFASHRHIGDPRPALLLLVALGVMDSTANLLFAWASTEGNVAVVAVLGSLYPVTTVGLAWLITHERVAGYQYGAAAVALAGVAVISAA